MKKFVSFLLALMMIFWSSTLAFKNNKADRIQSLYLPACLFLIKLLLNLKKFFVHSVCNIKIICKVSR